MAGTVPLLRHPAHPCNTLAHAADLRAVERAIPDAGHAVPPAPPRRAADDRAKAAERRERRLARYNQVWALHRDGWSGTAIARHLGIGHSTVTRYLRHETFPERRRSDAGRSRLDRWKPLLLERWNAGCRHSRRLFREIQGQGYRGSYQTLARYTQRLRQAQEGAARRRPGRGRTPPPVADPHRRPLTPRNAAWLVLRRPEHCDAADVEQLARLRTQHAALGKAITLAEEFVGLIRAKEPERLDPWLTRAQDSALPAFRNFAKKLDDDHDAVSAAVTLSWSTGQVEGQINRLKMIKRQMFGRANFDLLDRRFMLAA
jgi:transposase